MTADGVAPGPEVESSLTRTKIPATRLVLSSPLFARLLLVAIVIAAIEVAGRRRALGVTTLISVTEMLGGLEEIARDGEIWSHLTTTLGGLAKSLAISLSAGGALGFVMWKIPRLGFSLNPYLIAAWSVPWFFFYPVLLALFGLGDMPSIVVASLMMLVPIAISTWSALRSIPRQHIKLAAALRLSALDRAAKIYFPAATPTLFAGLRVAAMWGLAALIAMEFIAATSGLGFFVKTRLEYFQPRPMYGGIVFVMALGVGFAAGMRWLEGKIRSELT